MKTLRKKIGIVLLMAMLVSLLTPAIPAEAAEEPYLAYQKDAFGAAVNKMSSAWAENYKVEKLLLTPGAKQDLCFINAGNWKDSKWKSSNTKVAKVDGKGNVTGVGEGEATITLTYKKRITNKTVTVKAKVCVGEKYWGLDAGITKNKLDIDCYEMRVGGDMDIKVFGLPNLEKPTLVYTVNMTSSNPKVAEAIGDTILARKAGTAVVTVSVKNRLNGVTWTKNINVNVTNPVSTTKNATDQYLAMYGKDYLQLFKSGELMFMELDYNFVDAASEEMHRNVDSMGLAGLIEVLDIDEWVKLAFDSKFNVSKHVSEENRRAAAQFLIREITQDSQNEIYLGELQEFLKKAKLCIKNTKDLSDALDMILTGELSMDKIEATKLADFFLKEKIGSKLDVAKYGISAVDYMITTFYLYDLDCRVMARLQGCSEPGSALYEDIELLKTERQKNPVKYCTDKFFSDVAANVIVKIIKKAAVSEITFILEMAELLAGVAGEIAGVADLSDTAKAVRLGQYLSELGGKAHDIQYGICKNPDKYSDAELLEMIQEYEFYYSAYLSLVEPALQAIDDLDPITSSRILTDAKLAPVLGYDYNRHIAMAMALYYARNGVSNSVVNTTPAVNAQWSEWQKELPSHVDTKKYQVESKTQYSYRTKTKQKGYSDWSAWQAQPIAQIAGTEVETRTVYGYYYYYCSNCGAHMHGYGTNACYTWAGGCGSSIPATNAVTFFDVSPHSTGLGDWYGTGKYYKVFNGEYAFKWENYFMQEYRSRTYTEGEQTVYSDWSDYSDKVYTADSDLEVRTRTVYRYKAK